MRLAAVLLVLAAWPPADARDRAVPREFQRLHPCPSTGKTHGACPGWVRDHARALACGGPDRPGNLQWMTVEAAKEKDKWERKDCGG